MVIPSALCYEKNQLMFKFIIYILMGLSLLLPASVEAEQALLNTISKRHYRIWVVSSNPALLVHVYRAKVWWEKSTHISNLFSLTMSANKADIIITSSDSLGSKLGIAYVPPLSGPCLINISEKGGMSLSTVSHEIGHCMGLGHSDNPRSIMYGIEGKAQIMLPETIEAVKELYERAQSGATNQGCYNW